jgi:hypothetical protein
MSETNANCACLLRMFSQVDPGGIEPAMLHAAAVKQMSAPGVVDLPPEHTAEILTWALRIAGAATTPDCWSRNTFDAVRDCPPHVRKALRGTT